MSEAYKNALEEAAAIAAELSSALLEVAAQIPGLALTPLAPAAMAIPPVPAALATPAAPLPPSAMAVPPVPTAPIAPAAPAAPASGKRTRRTKEQIAQDVAAVAAGFPDHAAMLAAQGGAVQPGTVGGAPAAPAYTPAMPAAPVAPGAVPAVPAVPQPPVPAAPAAPAAPVPPPAPVPVVTPLDDLQAAFISFASMIEKRPNGVGHGMGQAGLLLGKLGYTRLEDIPAESIDHAIKYVSDYHKYIELAPGTWVTAD